MFRIFINIAVSLVGFSSFIYLTLFSVYRLNFDYERNMLRTSLLFIVFSVAAMYITNTVAVFDSAHTFPTFAVLASTVFLMGLFAHSWGKYGRHLMPKVPIREEISTLYDFTPKFAVTKFFEIVFQNVLAYILVVSAEWYFNDLRYTILLFATTFLVTHLFTVSFFGRQWGIFMAIMAPVGGVLVVVGYLLVPNGIVYVICFHILMYLLFLIVLRRLALRNQPQY